MPEVKPEQFVAFLKKTEGLRLKPYADSAGHATIGYGHKILPGENFAKGIDERAATTLLAKDITEHYQGVQRVYDSRYGDGEFMKLGDTDRMKLLGIAYNAGPSSHPKFMDAVREGDVARQLEHYRTHSNGVELPRSKHFRDLFYGKEEIGGGPAGVSKAGAPAETNSPLKALLSDPKFLELRETDQVQRMAEVSQDFAKLWEKDQDKAKEFLQLFRAQAEDEQDTDSSLMRSLKGGFQLGIGGALMILANGAKMLEDIGIENDLDDSWRKEAYGQIIEANRQIGSDWQDQAAAIIGAVPGGLAIPGLATLAIGAGLATAGAAPAAVAVAAPAIGFGGAGFLGAYDRGLGEAAKRGGIDAALGVLAPATQHLSRLSRIAINGGAALTLSEHEAAQGKLTEALVFGVMAGLPGRRPPLAVMSKLAKSAKATTPEVALPSITTEAEAQHHANRASIAARELEVPDDGAGGGYYADLQRRYGQYVESRHPHTWEEGERTPWQQERIANREPEALADDRPVVSSEPPVRSTGIDDPQTGEVIAFNRSKATFAPGPNWQKGRENPYGLEIGQHLGTWFGKKAVVAQDVISKFAKAFRVPIHEDIRPKDRLKGNLGWTYPVQGRTVAVRHDVGTAAHEIGHQLSWLSPWLRSHHDLTRNPQAVGISQGKQIMGQRTEKVKADMKRLDDIARANGLEVMDGQFFERITDPITNKKIHVPSVKGIFELHKKGVIPDDLQYIPELLSVSYDRNNTTEGMAEAMRHWLTNDTRFGGSMDFEKQLPHVDKILGEWRKNLPAEQRKAVDTFRKEAHAYYSQVGEISAGTKMGPPSRDPGAVLSTSGAAARQAMIDDFAGIQNLERVSWGTQLKDSVYEAFRLLRGTSQAADGMIDLGAPVWRFDDVYAKANPGKPPRMMIRYEGKSLSDIFRRTPSRRQMRKFMQYAVGRQADELSRQAIDKRGVIRDVGNNPKMMNAGMTREKLFTRNEIESMLALERDNPHFRDMFDDLLEFANKMADFGEQAGLWSRSQRLSWRRKQFVFSFLREMEDRAARGIESAGLLTGAPTRMLRGSTRRLRDPLQNLIDTHTRTFKMAVENVAKQELMRFLTQVPGAGRFGRIAKQMPRMREFEMEKVKEALKKELKNRYPLLDKADLDALIAEELPNNHDIERISMFIGNAKPHGDNIMTTYYDGAPKYYEVDDPLLMRSIQAMRRPQLTGFLQYWDALRNWKQRWITRGPGFLFANVWRDAAMASVMSRTGSFHFTKAVGGITSALRKDAAYREFIANGGGGAGVREPIEEIERRLIAHAGRVGFNPRNLIVTPRDALRALDKFGRTMEIASRLGEYKAARKQGASARHAAYLGREVSTDFAMRGDSRNMQFFTATVPFLNAMIQGGDRLYRGVMYDPSHRMATAIKMAMVGMSSIALYAINRQIPQFLDLPQWDKDGYWHIFLPKWSDEGDRLRITEGRFAGMLDYEHFKLPKLWEVGLLGSIGERFIQSMLDDPSEETGGLAVGLAHMITQNFGVNLDGRAFPLPIPVGADVVVEQFSNRILHTGNPIESQSRANQESWSRTRPGAARVFGEYGKLVRDVPTPPFLDWMKSPARVEALLRGVFGEFVQMGAGAVDRVYWPGGPAGHASDLPGVSRFYESPGKYSRQENEFYDRRAKVAEASATMSFLAKHPSKAGTLEEWISDPQTMARIGMSHAAEQASGVINAIDNQIEMIKMGDFDATLDPEEKQRRIDELTDEKREVMQTLNTVMKNLEEKFSEDRK